MSTLENWKRYQYDQYNPSERLSDYMKPDGSVYLLLTEQKRIELDQLSHEDALCELCSLEIAFRKGTIDPSVLEHLV